MSALIAALGANQTVDEEIESCLPPRRNDRINALIDALVITFGPDACDVPEAQIENAATDEAWATWTAVWMRLCVPPGRPPRP